MAAPYAAGLARASLSSSSMSCSTGVGGNTVRSWRVSNVSTNREGRRLATAGRKDMTISFAPPSCMHQARRETGAVSASGPLNITRAQHRGMGNAVLSGRQWNPRMTFEAGQGSRSSPSSQKVEKCQGGKKGEHHERKNDEEQSSASRPASVASGILGPVHPPVARAKESA